MAAWTINPDTQFLILKSVHTLITVLGASSVLYILYCGVRGRTGRLLSAAIIYTAIIGLLLAFNGGTCILQSWARRLLHTDYWVSDIYIPDWAANLITPIFVPLAIIGYGLIAWRRIQRRRSSR